MANEEHLALLKQGVWNEWRTENKLRYVVPDLSGANLSGLDLKSINFSFTNLRNTNLRGANLRRADFIKARIDGADLRETDLREALFDQGVKLSGANLVRANLSGLVLAEADLYLADLEEADLSEADLERAVLVEANLSKANLKEANLSAADLSDADLDGASMIRAELVGTNLSVASLRGANLTGANLASGQARSTDFTEAIFTGACIEDWHINSSTKLDAVDCQYVYRKYGLSASDPTKIVYRERWPSSESFAPGEFAERFKVAQNTIELAFRNGVPWQAFAYAFNESNIKVLDEYGDELFLQEYKVLGGGLVTLKVCYPPNANGDKIKSSLEERTHELELQIAHLTGVVGTQASTLAMMERLFTSRNSMSGDRKIYTGGGSYYESINTGGGDYIQGDYINMSQDLTQVVSQIQDLVEQHQKQGVTVDVAKQQVADDLAKQAKSSPTVKEKLTKWVQDAAGKAVVTEVVKEVLKGAAASVGIHLP